MNYCYLLVEALTGSWCGQASHAPKLGLIKWRLRNWIQLVFSFEKSSEPWNWKWASYLQLVIKLRPHSWHTNVDSRHSQNYRDSRITLIQNIGSSKHTQIQSHSRSFTLNPHLDHFVIMSLVFLITVHLETVSIIIIREYECEHGVGNARQEIAARKHHLSAHVIDYRVVKKVHFIQSFINIMLGVLKRSKFFLVDTS